MKVDLKYSGGSIIISGNVSTPYGTWDPRINAYRAMGFHYRDILKYLIESKITFEDKVLNLSPTPEIKGSVTLYPFQRDAFDNWIRNEKRGVAIIATAGGKTFLGLKAIETLNVPAIVLVPTLDLIDQWCDRIREKLNFEAGVIGGDRNEVKFVTVSTYDSAYIRAEELGNRFMLLIADECHHIFAPGYIQIAEMYVSPYRLGLTSTLYRPDMRHREFLHLIGGVIYEASHEQLTGKYISPYEHEKIFIELTPEEKKKYDQQYDVFRSYLERNHLIMRSLNDFHKLIMRSGYDKSAREAILARNAALKTALNSETKMQFLQETLKKTNEKTLIFTLHNDMVYKISRRFLIPAITCQTPPKERKEIIQKFKTGEYKAIVSSQVLDEGVDVPDASLGIILSGTGSQREYIQRLGRLLRKGEDKIARLIEVVSKETTETRLSERRHRRNQDAAE